MKSTAKSESVMRDLKQRLEKRIANSSTIDTVRETRDSDGYPALILSNGGAEATTNAVIAIRMEQVDAVSKDIFGNSLLAYTPHAMDIAYELDANGKQTPSQLDLAIVLQEVSKLGVLIQIRQLAAGTAVTMANVDAAAVAKVLEYDVSWPTKGA